MNTTDDNSDRILHWLRLAGWGGAVALILAPLIAMQFTTQVNWGPGDFLVAALMIGGVGLAAELAVRISSSWFYRIGAGLGLAAGFFLIWANLAVGYIGSEDNPYNLAFFGVVAIAFAGAVIAAFRPKGMAVTMLIAGLAHALAGAIGYAEDAVTGPITIIFVGMWLGSARLFQLAARDAA